MKLDFAKLHGLGNDFIIIDNFSEDISLTKEQVSWLCDRHFGIGADGVILVEPSKRSECVAYMHYINSDGTLAEMCGNGVRCFAKYLIDRGFIPTDTTSFIADTLAGPRPLSFEVDREGKMVSATVDMGEPVLTPEKIPTTLFVNDYSSQNESYVKEAPLSSEWGDFKFTCVSMGNPHAVCFIDDWNVLPDELFSNHQAKNLKTFKLDLVGAFYESHSVFPEKANVEFASIHSDGIRMRVFERGCGETLACGTGACATLVAASLTGRSVCENDVFLPGGKLHIIWNDGNRITMTGPAAESFTGVVTL